MKVVRLIVYEGDEASLDFHLSQCKADGMILSPDRRSPGALSIKIRTIMDERPLSVDRGLITLIDKELQVEAER